RAMTWAGIFCARSSSSRQTSAATPARSSQTRAAKRSFLARASGRSHMPRVLGGSLWRGLGAERWTLRWRWFGTVLTANTRVGIQAPVGGLGSAELGSGDWELVGSQNLARVFLKCEGLTPPRKWAS